MMAVVKGKRMLIRVVWVGGSGLVGVRSSRGTRD